jgi:hypothetical protein
LKNSEKNETPADFTVYFSLSLIFLLPSFLIIVHFFNLNPDLMAIHRAEKISEEETQELQSECENLSQRDGVIFSVIFQLSFLQLPD